MNDYDVIIVPLKEEDGGGFAAFCPDLPGCMSDGETRAQAAENIEDAIQEWIATQKERGLPIPKRGDHAHKMRQEQRQIQEQMRKALEKLEASEGSSLIPSFPVGFTPEATPSNVH